MNLRFHIPNEHIHTHSQSFAPMCERCCHTAKQQAVFRSMQKSVIQSVMQLVKNNNNVATPSSVTYQN